MVTSDDELPGTLTPNIETTTTVSLFSRENPVIGVWGRLISCRTFLNSIDLVNSTFTLGRSEQCDEVMCNEKFPSTHLATISKKHFEISRAPDSSAIYITDMSKNGTYINKEKIGKNKRYVLRNDDVISIGLPKFEAFVFKNMSAHYDDFLPPELKIKYDAIKGLGRGACGEVRLAIERSSCNKYAIKKIIKGRTNESQMHKINHPSKIQTEISILKSLSHPCIIGMKEIIETQNEVFIVLEYMEGGELSKRIQSIEPMTESNIKFHFYQMLLAVQYLHSEGIAHRDLKPENILLSSDRSETILKISDFGLSKVTEGQDNMQTICGTLSYAAPEVLNTQFREYGEYGKQVDIWSLGVILYYMLSKELPFPSKDKAILINQIITGSYEMDGPSWSGISHSAQDLVKRMLTVHPHKRISIKEILQHHWIDKDIVMQFKVHSLLSPDIITEPPKKKFRIEYVEESVDSDITDEVL